MARLGDMQDVQVSGYVAPDAPPRLWAWRSVCGITFEVELSEDDATRARRHAEILYRAQDPPLAYTFVEFPLSELRAH